MTDSTITDGLIVSGGLDAAPGIAAEFQGSQDCLVALRKTGTANTTDETAFLGYSKTAGGGYVKSWSVSCVAGETADASYYNILRLNATYASGDYLGVRIFGGKGVTLNGTSDSDVPNTAQNVYTLVRKGLAIKDGNFMIGKDTASIGESAPGCALSYEGYYISVLDPSSGVHAYFANNATAGTPQQCGSISSSGTSTSYNTTSDERLKDDRGEMPYSTAAHIMRLIQIHDFQWKTTGEKSHGAFAQELYKVYPQAVTMGKGTPGAPNFEPWGVDYSKLVPVMARCMQGIMDRLDKLESEK